MGAAEKRPDGASPLLENKKHMKPDVETDGETMLQRVSRLVQHPRELVSTWPYASSSYAQQAFQVVLVAASERVHWSTGEDVLVTQLAALLSSNQCKAHTYGVLT